MLIMLYGTSCSGKTAIIKSLISNKKYIPIDCYTTREPRESDLARICISNELFHKMEDNYEFEIVNNHLNAKYGNLKNDFKNAVKDKSKIYILDFLIKDFIKLENYNHLKIILIPENEQQLRKQIFESNRQEREEDIIKDFKDNFNSLKLNEYQKKGFEIVTNKYNKLGNTIDEIHKLATNGSFNG